MAALLAEEEAVRAKDAAKEGKKPAKKSRLSALWLDAKLNPEPGTLPGGVG